MANETRGAATGQAAGCLSDTEEAMSMTDQSSCEQLKDENEAYWTNRASGYSEVNKDELRTQQKAVWTAELTEQIEAAFPGAPGAACARHGLRAGLLLHYPGTSRV